MFSIIVSKSSNSELDSFYQLKNIQNEVKSASMLKTCVLSSIVCPSIELFHVNYFKKHIPVKLTGKHLILCTNVLGNIVTN